MLAGARTILKEAEWIPHEGSEVERLHPFRVPRYSPRLTLSWTLGVVSLLALFASTRATWSDGSLEFYLGFLATGAWIMVLLQYRLAPRHRDRLFWGDKVRDPYLEWNVDLAIIQENLRTGRDSGKLWIQDGAICFLGKRTSFALSSDQLGSVNRIEDRRRDFSLKRLITIRLAP